jgi:hypothetical protein
MLRHGRLSKRGKSLLTAIAIALVVGSTLGSSVAGAGAVRTSFVQTCPASPHGWTAAPSNPTIFGPAQQPGQHQTMVTCSYSQGKKSAVSVTAEYANTFDPNPNTDFYFGCRANRDQAWDLTHRLYFIENPDNWSYVEFADPGHQLPGDAVPGFEQVAKTLLGNVAHLAHGCRVDTTTPTTLRHLYLFGFEFFVASPNFKAFGGVPAQTPKDELIPEGSFSATTAADATIVSKIVAASAPPFIVQVIDHSKVYKLRMRITGGTNFVVQPPTQRLDLSLAVTRSTYPRCQTGSRGSVSIVRSDYSNSPTAPAFLRVRLCGAVFGHGTYHGTALIISG